MTAEKDKDARGGGGTRKSRRTGGTSAAAAPGMTVRARRRREEAVRRLVADVQSKATALSSSSEHDPNTNSVGVGGATTAAMAETHDWLVASAVATALEKGLDRDLHAELIQEAKDNAGRIGQVCHDHADVFLQSVAQVAALATPSADLAEGIQNAQSELRSATTGPMHEAATAWEEARQSYARARTVTVMVDACQSVAIQMERARKQAALGRPRAALDAVDRARTALTTPVESLFQGPDEQLWKETVASEMRNNTMTATAAVGSAADKGASSITAAAVNASSASLDLLGPSTTSLLPGGANSSSSKKLSNLEQTPFGKRAILFLPKIETEVLLSARRGLNRWLLALRSGDAAKAGRAAIRETAHAAAAGPGALGLGGSLPASFLWRAQMAENWMARTGQATKVARACRLGYYFDRDAVQDAEKLQNALLNSAIHEGSERYVEAIAVAMGWYRCWEDGSALLVDPFEYLVDGGGGGMDGSSRGTGASRHGLSGSRHGLSGNSRHGLRASRHGPGSATKKSLGFRASTNSRSQAYQETMTSALGTAAGAGNNKVTIQTTSLWTELLLPNILLSVSPTRFVE